MFSRRKEKLLTPSDILAIVPVSRPTLQRWFKAHQLPYLKIGGRIFVHPHDFRAFLEKCHVR